MSRVILRNAYWITLGFVILTLLSLVGCTSVPKQPATAIVLPTIAPAQKSVSSVRAATVIVQKANQDTRGAIDQAISLAQKEALAATDAERKQDQEAFQLALQTAKKVNDDAVVAATAALARADEAQAALVSFQSSQDKAALAVQAAQAENEAYRQRELAGHKFWGLGFVWVGIKMFLVHAIAWIAGFAVLAGILSFFFPPIAAFFSVVLTNIIHLFRPRT